VAFLQSMEMDLDVQTYQTYADLLTYMEGSAAVIGTMMLPILAPTDAAAAREPARQLGLAFQLTNFIRDVAEDLDRGRIYLPQEDLDRFGVTAADLKQARSQRRSGQRLRALIRYEIARARSHYALAAPGIPLLPRRSQACIRTAFHLYAAILDEIERQHFDVFVGRAVVPRRTLLRVVLRSLLTPTGRAVAVAPGPLPAWSG
jgi:phytoene synthase